MKVSCQPLSRISWDDVAPLIGDSFFGSPGFANLWYTLGGKPVYWLVEQGNRIVAVLPGVEFGIRPLKRFYAMPAGCYTRLFYNPDITVDRERIARMVLDALADRRYLKLFIYDFYESLPADSRFNIQARTTTLMDISGPDWQPPDKKLQYEIRRAVREGIQAVTFDWDLHHRRFLKLMRSTEKRHGQTPAYSPGFFKAVADLAREDDRIQWVWCEHNGCPASSHIYLIENTTLQGWQVYFDKAFSFLKPNQYIRFMMCRKMAQRGITKFNQGTTPAGAEGLAYYKKRWGGKPVHYCCYVMKRGLGRFL